MYTPYCNVMDTTTTCLLVCLVCVASCHGLYVGKRAVASVPIGSSSEVLESTPTTISPEDQFIKFWLKTNQGLCPPGQINHVNNASDLLCCLPVSCGPEEEVLPCTKNGTEDVCSKCKPGYRQTNNVTSLNMADATCFLEKREHKDCPADWATNNQECTCVTDDMKPSRNQTMKHFPLDCQCKFELCYYPLIEIGTCQRQLATTVCEAGQQMNITGDCVPCEWYQYKNKTGCEPCTQNDQWLRYGRPDGAYVPPTPTTTKQTSTAAKPPITSSHDTNFETEKTDASHSQPNGDNNTTVIVAIIVSVTFFSIIVAVLVFSVIRRGVCCGDVSGPHSRETLSPLLTPPSSNPVTPTSPNGLTNGTLQNGETNVLSEQFIQATLLQQNAPMQNGKQHINGNGHIRGFVEAYGNTNGTCNGINPTPQSELQIINPSAGSSNMGKDEQVENRHNINNGNNVQNDDMKKVTKPERKQPLISIHGNQFKDCVINIPHIKMKQGKQRVEEVSGSFGFDSSLDSSGLLYDSTPHDVNTASTAIQPGRRRDAYANNQAHGQNANARAMVNTRPDRSGVRIGNNDIGISNFEDQRRPQGEVIHEDHAMEMLKRPNYLDETMNDTTTQDKGGNYTVVLPEMDKTKTAAVFRNPNPPPRPTATVAPIRQQNRAEVTRLQSVQVVSGYPTIGINDSEGTSSAATGYVFANLSSDRATSDIADSRDFTADQSASSYTDDSHDTSGTISMSEETARKVQAVSGQSASERRGANNVQSAVHPVSPLYTREQPDGDSGRHNDSTSEKVVAIDETDVKALVNSSHTLDTNEVEYSYDSDSDLKKPIKPLAEISDHTSCSNASEKMVENCDYESKMVESNLKNGNTSAANVVGQDGKSSEKDVESHNNESNESDNNKIMDTTKVPLSLDTIDGKFHDLTCDSIFSNNADAKGNNNPSITDSNLSSSELTENLDDTMHSTLEETEIDSCSVENTDGSIPVESSEIVDFDGDDDDENDDDDDYVGGVNKTSEKESKTKSDFNSHVEISDDSAMMDSNKVNDIDVNGDINDADSFTDGDSESFELTSADVKAATSHLTDSTSNLTDTSGADTSVASFELDSTVDIDAIQRDVQCIQNIPCRGER